MSPCSGSSTLTLEVLDRVVKHQRSQGQLQLQALIQTMWEATRFLFSYQIFDLMPSECIPRSILPGGDTHLHRSAVQIWSPFPQVQPLTVEISTHVTPASVCVCVCFLRAGQYRQCGWVWLLTTTTIYAG